MTNATNASQVGPGWLWRRVAAGIVTALIGCAVATTAWADADALWRIVHERCVPNQQQNNDPAPCKAVDLSGGEARGHALLKDLVGASQYLLIPTAKIAGTESPEILFPGAPNYFAAAWAARSEIEVALHRSLQRDAIGLAINSASGRSQNQLHIHIDCLRPDVIAALRANADAVGETWSAFPVPLAGHSYMARRLGDAQLSQLNPFRLVADGIPAAAADMGHETLVVAGASFADGQAGFILLADHADLLHLDTGSGEQLQDHSCSVAK